MYEPFPNENMKPGDCESCNGVGRVMYAFRRTGGWTEHQPVMCIECLGEKRISENLRERKAAARALGLAMDVRRLSAVDCAKRFGGRVQDWAEARIGLATLQTILQKHETLERSEHEARR